MGEKKVQISTEILNNINFFNSLKKDENKSYLKPWAVHGDALFEKLVS